MIPLTLFGEDSGLEKLGLKNDPKLATPSVYRPGLAPWEKEDKKGSELKKAGRVDGRKESKKVKMAKLKADSLKRAVKITNQWRRLYQKLVRKTKKTKGEWD
jgi:hypothetical protein